jgi:hypothetical protein
MTQPTQAPPTTQLFRWPWLVVVVSYATCCCFLSCRVTTSDADDTTTTRDTAYAGTTNNATPDIATITVIVIASYCILQGSIMSPSVCPILE